MAAFIFTLVMIWILMWAFFRFMYPKPPKAFMPKEGDITTPRHCDFCGYPLAEYRGVLEDKTESALTAKDKEKIDELTQQINEIAIEEKRNDTDDAKLSRQEKKALQLAEQEKKEALFQHKHAINTIQTWFFCNYEHQSEFHASRHQDSNIQSSESAELKSESFETDSNDAGK